MNLNQEITMTMKLWEIVAYHIMIWGTLLSLAIKAFCFITEKVEAIVFRKERQEMADKMMREFMERMKK